MKTNLTLKKMISMSLSVSLLAACSTQHGSSGNAAGENAGMVIKTKADSLYAEWLNKVAKGEISLLAAEAMVPALRLRIQETGESLTVSAIPKESFDLSQFKYQITKKENSFIQSAVMGGENIFSHHADELSLTLPFNIESGNYSVLGIDHLMDLGILREESQRRLESVFKIYDDAAKQAAYAEAQKRLADAQIDAELAETATLPANQKKAQIKNIIDRKKLDDVPPSGKPDVDVVVRKYLNEALYDILMNNSYTHNAVVSGAIAANAIERLQKTAEAFSHFRDSVQSTWSELKNAQTQLGEGLQGVRDQFSQFNVEDVSHDPDAMDRWKKAFQEGKNIIEGKVDSENPTANETAVNEAYKKVKDSSQKLAQSTRTLADSGQLLVDAGKLFLDSETVSKAQAVVDGVSKVSMIIDKLSSGGVTGVLGAANIALGGVGGGVDVAASRHAELTGKLDALLKGQKIMIELQRETIQLQKHTLQAVADVAQMIDINQRIIMARMDGMEAQLATLTEYARFGSLNNFNTCDHVLYGKTSENEAARLSSLQKGLNQSFGSFEAMQSLIGNSDRKEDYVRCRRGVQELFLNEGQLSLVMSYGGSVKRAEVEASGLTPVEKVRLKPLGDLFIQKYRKNLTSPAAYFRGLHMPVRYMSLVPLADQFYNLESESHERFSVDSPYYFFSSGFLNPNMVILQVKSLLTIAKMNSVLGEGSWTAQKPFALDVTSKLQNEIQSAQSLVQTAIAQESLVSGEPILSHIYDQALAAMSPQGSLEFTTSDCDQKLAYDRMGCMLKKNPVLLHNFTQYFFHRRLAGDNPDVNELLKFHLGASGSLNYKMIYLEAQNFSKGSDSTFQLEKLGNVSYVKGSKVPTIKLGEVEMALPTPEEYEADLIQYSNEMYELQILQRDLIQTRMKLENLNLSEEERRILAEVLFNNVQ